MEDKYDNSKKTQEMYISDLENLPHIDVAQHELKLELASKLPESYARHFHAILLEYNDDHCLVGMVNPLDIFATDELHNVLKKPIKFILVNEKDLHHKLDQLYRRTNDINDFANKLELELQQNTNEEEKKLLQQKNKLLNKQNLLLSN